MPDFAVIDLPPADHPVPGDTAPDFTRPLVTAEYWEDMALSDLLENGPVLLVFYPMNWGGKSVYTWNEIRDRGWGEGVQVVGVSIGTPFDHGRFIEARQMDYALFSDPANGVAERYDVVNDLGGMSGISEPRPAVFLVDPNRTVEYAWVTAEWPATPPYDAVEDALERG